jgi:hypothetical protein
MNTSKSWQEIGKTHEDMLTKHGWENFRRTVAGRYFTRLDFTEADIEAMYDQYKAAGVMVRGTDLLEGNPVHIVRDGRIVTQDLLTSNAELGSMKNVVDFNGIKTVVEIGGGYGRMAHLALQLYPHLSWTIVDVKPAIDVSRRFLSSKYPQVRFIEAKNFEFEQDADLVYSSSVMSEIGRANMERYFSYINQYAKFFYLKDWKIGHHTNETSRYVILCLRAIDKLSRIFTRRRAQIALNMIAAYKISENNYPHYGWTELLHSDALTPDFFEVVYRI